MRLVGKPDQGRADLPLSAQDSAGETLLQADSEQEHQCLRKRSRSNDRKGTDQSQVLCFQLSLNTSEAQAFNI